MKSLNHLNTFLKGYTLINLLKYIYIEINDSIFGIVLSCVCLLFVCQNISLHRTCDLLFHINDTFFKNSLLEII